MKESDKLENQNKNEIPEPSSSLALELFIFIHKIYLYIYNIILIIPEVILAIVALILNVFRLRLSSIGNKTERALILLFAIIIGIINIVCYIYFMWIQTYVTYFDLVFSLIGVIITFLEIFFSFWTMFNIKVHEKSD